MATQVETHQFQAETEQLLDLVVHSLYTNKDIFLRELISNASDALDRLRFELLTNPELKDDDAPLQILLECDRQARTLTVSDNGIGMSQPEVISNIGTIARSGAREFRQAFGSTATEKNLPDLIGQFGVGFYSAFMVADKVVLVTRRRGETVATQWESTGRGEYTLSTVDKSECGTSITLHLKNPDPESGIEDYTDKWILARIIKRYSDFIAYPIVFRDEQPHSDDPLQIEQQETSGSDKVLNSMKPIWTRSPAEISETELSDFYKHISHDFNDPILHVMAKAEGVLEYIALVFIPATAPYDLYYHATEAGLNLYAKGVLVMERTGELVPRYLRFLRGIVDSSDLPLNISRQMLQQDRQITHIRKWLTKKTLDALRDMFENDREKYFRFWEQFGRALKEGVSSDFDNRDKLVALLLFPSSADPAKLTTLKDYVSRMKDDQQEIFYLTGESYSVIDNSPHLEAVKAKGYEVLYLTDPVDELLVQTLTEFEGKKLKSLRKGAIDLPTPENDEAEQILKQQQAGAAELLEAMQRCLDQHVKEVRLTNRLTASPACLVGSEMDYSPQMERLLLIGKNGRPRQRRILELNPQHQIVVKLQERYRETKSPELLNKYSELLLGYALLAEGSELVEPVRFSNNLVELMAAAI